MAAIDFPNSPLNGDSFTANGSTWIYISSTNTWDLLRTQPVGPTGPTGPIGATGPTGPGATVDVGTVITGTPGSSASVLNVGTTQAAVLNFTVPQGPTGPTGPGSNTVYTTTISTSSATLIDTVTLSTFQSIKYVLSIKQGSKTRLSELLVATDGISTVNYVEFGVMTTGSDISGLIISPAAVGSALVFQITIADANITPATVRINKVVL